jgi:fructokinase
MSAEFFAFGEILWDCLPSGKQAGGAPFNVAAHLAQLGASVGLISAVGRDAAGDEILAVAAERNVDTRFVSRSRAKLPTGRVLVTFDNQGSPSYDVVQPAAWDEIDVTAEALDAVSASRAFTFGSLACRSVHNFRQLGQLLDIKGPMKFFDPNLRPPFVDAALILELAKRADVLKLNNVELGSFAGWIRGSDLTVDELKDERPISAACEALASATNLSRICVTMGEKGALLWQEGSVITTRSPNVVVSDTVGAGDAFMAGLMLGLARGQDPQTALENATRLGTYVASQDGATPLLPVELARAF